LAGLDLHQLDSIERFHVLTIRSSSPTLSWRERAEPLAG
jgi:hypothetical protein